jgi:N-acetyl-anhydromuramoyl-L-alanine amidase
MIPRSRRFKKPMAADVSRITIDTTTGLVAGARQVLSSHFDARPSGTTLDLIVIHCISLPPYEFGGRWVDRLFTGNLPRDEHPYFAGIANLRVSAHLLIPRDGTLVQYVPLHSRAWHAGQSEWRGRTACNDFSVGIELEGTETTPYDEPQYRTLDALIDALIAVYPTLGRDKLAAHSEIAPGRKLDPGPHFDWTRVQRA